MKHLVILVSLLVCSFLAYENFNLRFENTELDRHVNQQSRRIDTLQALVIRQELLIDKKDEAIELLTEECDRLAAGVLRLWELLQREEDSDRVT